jgi:hypothetical protein
VVSPFQSYYFFWFTVFGFLYITCNSLLVRFSSHYGLLLGHISFLILSSVVFHGMKHKV